MRNLAERVEIGASPLKMIGVVTAGAGMTTASGLLAFRVLPNIPPGSLAEFLGYVGLVFFGLCTVLLLWRLLTTRGAVVTMDAHGIRDKRVADSVIPWSAVRDISIWEMQRQKILVLAVDPAVDAQLKLSKIARWTRRANRGLGANGLCITAQGLRIGYDELLATAKAFWGR